MTEPTTFDSLLHALELAQLSDDLEAVQTARFALLQHRFDTQGGVPLSDWLTSGDMQLLHDLATDLKRQDKYAEALPLYQLAQSCAAAIDNQYLCALYALYEVQCLIGQLLFSDAAAGLVRLFGLDDVEQLQDRGRALAAALAPLTTAIRDEDLHNLGLYSLYTLGRYWAAIGAFGNAEQAFVEALARMERAPSALIVPTELALLLAETRLDRGDFAGVKQLEIYLRDEPPESLLRNKWRLLHAMILLLQGQYSAADKEYVAILAASAAGPGASALAAQKIRDSARWQRLHVLVALNRLDDADELLQELAADGSVLDDSLQFMQAFLASRRKSAATDVTVPITAKEILEPLAGALPAATGHVSADPRALQRQRERARDDFAALSNECLLELYCGHTEEALHRLAWLKSWTESLDSSLLQIRLAHLMALVSYSCDEHAEAVAHAFAAMAGYVDLQMPGEEWLMCRLLLWALQRTREPDALTSMLREHESELLARLRCSLKVSDRIFFDLNKWSTYEESMASLCEKLHRELDGTPSVSIWRGLLRQRKSRALLAQMIRMKRGDWQSRRETAMVPSPEAADRLAIPDPFSLVRLRLRQAGAERRGGPQLHALIPSLLRPDTALVHYFVLPDRIEAFVTLRSGTRLLKIKDQTSRIDLWHTARKCLRRIYYDAWDDPKLQSVLAKLASALALSAILDLLPDTVQDLIIIPDDVLFHLPLAALPVPLPSGGTAPLLARYNLAVLPEISWRGVEACRATRYRSALGVAVADSSHARQQGLPYEPLAHVESEARAVESWLTATDFRLLRGADALRSKVAAALPDVEAAHFACHGDFNLGEPQRSGLLLEDGFLTIADLHAARFDKLRLAVLSSCWSGNMLVLPGRELVGIPMALLEQGAGAVITALWRVGDEFSNSFIPELYRQIQALGPLRGLSAAQRAWLARSRPRDWATFICYAGGLVPAGLVGYALTGWAALRNFSRSA